MMMMGFFEIIILLAMTSSFGVPVGLPPAAEEPFMYQVAPEKCLYFTTWATMAEADPDSDNRTERMIAEKEIVGFIQKLDQAFEKMVASDAIGNTNSDEEALIAGAMPDIARTLLTRATTAYVDQFELKGGLPHVSGGLVLSLGPNEKKISAHVLNLQKALAKDDVSEVEIAGKSFYQIPIPEGENLITWGIHDGRLLLTLGEGSMEKLLKNAETPAPDWLVQQKKDLQVERIASVSYVDLQEIMGMFRAAGKGERGAAFIFDMLENLGLDNFKSYRCVSGLEGAGVVDKTKIEFDGKRRGLMAAIGKASFNDKSLNKLPKDPLMAVALKIDPKQVYELIEENPAILDLDDRDFQQAVEQIDDVISGSFKEDLIGSLGDTVYIYTSANDGGLVTGWTLAIDVEQSMTLDQVMQRIVGFAKAAMMVGGRDAPVRIRNQNVQGNDVYYVEFEDEFMPFSPSWALVDDQLLFSLYPQAIKGHIARKRFGEGFASNPAVKELLAANADQGNSCMLTYTDMSEVIKFGYPFLIGAYTTATAYGGGEEFDLDPLDFPSVASLTKHLGPSVTLVRSTDTEFISESRHVMPSGNIGASVPALGAITMPAVFAARAAARRTQSANNLKQIGLGMHNYHDTFRGLPAPYSMDENGKPLLSWRVHILPFTEYQPLYDQFHFDEPWDSEHNKTLIEKMPAFYAVPGTDPSAGKTVYLGVGGDDAIFSSENAKVKGKTKFPVGANFAMVRDGTSNTIMVVEANQANSVIWTKPDDFDAPTMSPVKRLVGNWKGGFQVLFGDGSVQFISENIDVETLQNMFQMSDGKVIDRDFER